MPKCECSKYGTANRIGAINLLVSSSLHLILKVQWRDIVQHSSTLYIGLQPQSIYIHNNCCNTIRLRCASASSGNRGDKGRGGLKRAENVQEKEERMYLSPKGQSPPCLRRDAAIVMFVSSSTDHKDGGGEQERAHSYWKTLQVYKKKNMMQLLHLTPKSARFL